MDKIALFGGTGAIGFSIAEALARQNREFRVVGRNLASLQKQFSNTPGAEVRTWNPDDKQSVREAARGVQTLIYLVGVPYDQFQLHPILMRKTLEGAIAEGVQRFLLIGNVYPYGIPDKKPITEQHPRRPNSFKGRMRTEQEDALLNAGAAGKIQACVLRLPDFYGPGVEKSLLHDLFRAAATGKTANVLGPLDKPHEFVFVPDVGPVAVALAEHPRAYGRWWHLAGAGEITMQQMIDLTSEAAGKKVKARAAGKSVLRLLGLFNPLMRELVEMNYLMTDPVILDDSDLRGLLGEIHKTPYKEGVRIIVSGYCSL